ncbi:MAG: glycosyl hydrolase family 8 [Liquorilactobacillus hordei]|uniref:glycosyl hydrolase family 8 n=1 Tax=Liquorilactobacillus hordei TaxID=468911 RepID=UPI0039ECDA0B
MKKRILSYTFFAVVILAVSVTLLVIRQKSPRELQVSIYNQWNELFVHEVSGKKKAFINTKGTKKGNVSLSEAQGYGMLIATEQTHTDSNKSQETFDKLDAYYLSNRDAGTNLMSWKQVISHNGKRIKKYHNNATDGDLYIAYSLIRAAKKWPQKAPYYKKQAKAILEDILKYNYNSSTGSLMVGNWAKGTKYANLLRTSDVLPAQFEEFYHFTGDKVWLSIKDKMLSNLVELSKKHKTGLIPDMAWIKKDGSVISVGKKSHFGKYNRYYYYNACRLPYNLSQSNDSKSRLVLRKMMKFFMSREYIAGGYTLSGQQLSNYQSASFGAPIFYAAKDSKEYNKLTQLEKYIFMQKLEVNNYYQSALVTLASEKFFKN